MFQDLELIVTNESFAKICSLAPHEDIVFLQDFVFTQFAVLKRIDYKERN